MPENGHPILTFPMTPDQLAAFEERFMRDLFVMPDGTLAKSCLTCVDMVRGTYVRLYSTLVPAAPSAQEQKAEPRFFASTYKRSADGTLVDMTGEALPPWMQFNGSQSPQLVDLQDVVAYMSASRSLRAPDTSAPPVPDVVCPLDPADATAIKFSSPIYHVDYLTGQPDSHKAPRQIGRGEVHKLILSPKSFPEAKLH